MKDGTLSYNGAIYRLRSDQIKGLLARGVIVPDAFGADAYELAAEHVIEEVGDEATVLDRRTGAEARGEGTDEGRRRMIAVRYQHRDGQAR